MKKIIFYITILTVASLILTGCFGKSSSYKGLSAEDKDFASTKQENLKTADPEVFTIRVFSTLQGSVGAVYNFKSAVEKQYRKKYPKATIQWNEQEPYHWYRWSLNKLESEFAKGNAEDVVLNNEDFYKLVQDGYLLDLSDQPWVADLRSNIKEGLSYGGKVYGGSLGSSTSGVWYNKDIFSKLELHSPKTWSDFIALCTIIKANGMAPLAVGLESPEVAYNYFHTMALTAETLSNPDFQLNLHDGIGRVNGPEYQGILKKYLELTKKGFFYDDPLKGEFAAFKDFLTNKAAMTIERSFLPFMKDSGFDIKPTIKIGFFPLPDENGNAVLEAGQDYKVSINSSSKLIRQSQDLVALFMSKDISSIFAKETGYFPVSKEAAVDYPQPEFKEALQWVNKTPGDISKTTYLDYLPESTRRTIGEALIGIVSGKEYTGKELQGAQRTFDQDKGKVVIPELR